MRLWNALQNKKKAVQEAPENVEEYICLAAALFNAKQYEECFAFAKEAITKFPKEAILYGFAGDACRELKRYKEAFSYWEKHLELDSTWLDSYFSMGFCYEEIGEYKKAYEVWTQLADGLEQRGFESEVTLPRSQAQKCREKIST